MAHETHNEASTEQAKSTVSFKSSFWLVIILVGLFIAALNFINVMGEHGEGKHAEGTEMHGEKAHEANHEAGHEATHEAAHEAAKEGEATKEVKEEPKPAAESAPAPEHK